MMLRGAVIVCQVFDFIDLIYRYGVRDGVIFHGAAIINKEKRQAYGPCLAADRGRAWRRFPTG